jgi:hypothetical protein
MRQFFFSIPNELMECSQIDGLGNIGIFIRVILPLSVPALIAQFLLSFVGSYNAYLSPLIYLQSPDKYTLQIALNFFRGTYQTDWAVVMAGAAISLMPTMILFLFGQKYFIDGIAIPPLCQYAKKYPDLYRKLRCGLAHAYRPDVIILSNKGGVSDISCDDFYADFVAACRNILADKAPKKVRNLDEFFFDVTTTDDGTYSTATTTNNQVQ